jgi:2-phosphosulfolactate phosphatase
MTFQPHYVSIEDAGTAHGTAVVLDVLRAYTTAAWAFHLGAARLILTDDLDEALALKALLPGSLAMKDALPMPGFELSNSPVALRSHDLRGLTIIQRTTHGTVGAVAAYRAGVQSLFCAGFPNARATAEVIRRSGAHKAYFVITGELGAADEDRACAEYIAALIDDPDADAAPFVARVPASNTGRQLGERIEEGRPGVQKGDIEAAMEADRFDFVMRAREEYIEGAGQVLVLRAYNQIDD